jgi:hypothetical protein
VTKAEQVRKERLEARYKGISKAAKEIFDWMLDILSAETQDGYIDETVFWLFDDDYKLNTWFRNSTLDLRPIIEKYDRVVLFDRLKELIESEEGYKVEYEPHSTQWDSTCLRFTVSIE